MKVWCTVHQDPWKVATPSSGHFIIQKVPVRVCYIVRSFYPALPHFPPTLVPTHREAVFRRDHHASADHPWDTQLGRPQSARELAWWRHGCHHWTTTTNQIELSQAAIRFHEPGFTDPKSGLNWHPTSAQRNQRVKGVGRGGNRSGMVS